MSSYEYRLALIAIMGAISVVWGLGYLLHTWIRSRGRRALPEGAVAELRDQLSHLQVSVDTMAVEIERISEAQRFTAKVLTERAEPMRIERSGQTH
jgi:hypothetical protein